MITCGASLWRSFGSIKIIKCELEYDREGLGGNGRYLFGWSTAQRAPVMMSHSTFASSVLYPVSQHHHKYYGTVDPLRKSLPLVGAVMALKDVCISSAPLGGTEWIQSKKSSLLCESCFRQAAAHYFHANCQLPSASLLWLPWLGRGKFRCRRWVDKFVCSYSYR